jgi:ABC-type multidrug transport system fused ATPase/permease subunit
LGWAAFVGVAIMILSIPLNTGKEPLSASLWVPHPLISVIAGVLKRMQEQQMKNRDKRTRLMSEILSNIRTIKLFAWENTFIRRVLEVRNNQELKMLRKIGVVTVFVSTLFVYPLLNVSFCPGMEHGAMDGHTFACCFQLTRYRCLRFYEASDIRYNFPSNFPIHASPISSGSGMYSFFFSIFFYSLSSNDSLPMSYQA